MQITQLVNGMPGSHQKDPYMQWFLFVKSPLQAAPEGPLFSRSSIGEESFLAVAGGGKQISYSSAHGNFGRDPAQ